jgi:hypothetical protein
MRYSNSIHVKVGISALMTLLLSTLFSSCSEDAPAVQLPPTISSYAPTRQFTGQSITINGTNFGTSVNAVEVTFFDGAVATVEEVTNTSIVVTVPADAYVGPVTIKVKDLEVEGSEFEVMTICTSFFNGLPQPVPCQRIKPIGAL